MNVFLELFLELCIALVTFYIFKFTFHISKLDKLFSKKLLNAINSHAIIYVLIVAFFGCLFRRILYPLTAYKLIANYSINSSIPSLISLGLVMALISISFPKAIKK